jgi:hypothetical protein
MRITLLRQHILDFPFNAPVVCASPRFPFDIFRLPESHIMG